MSQILPKRKIINKVKKILDSIAYVTIDNRACTRVWFIANKRVGIYIFFNFGFHTILKKRGILWLSVCLANSCLTLPTKCKYYYTENYNHELELKFIFNKLDLTISISSVALVTANFIDLEARQQRTPWYFELNWFYFVGT